MADYSPFGSLAPMAPPDTDAMGSVYGVRPGLPSWYQSSFGALSPSQFPDAPPSRQDAAFQTSIDRWKQLAKDVLLAPAHALKEFNEKPTFMNSLGIMPMGTFGGPLAKTADRAALSTAERLAGKGAAREEIWDKTGWFQGPDQKWRFEIPDNAAKFREDLGRTSDPNFSKNYWSVSDAFDHPALYDAYLEAGKPLLSITGKPGGHYAPATRATAEFAATEPEIRVSNSEFANTSPKSMLLHELQHAVQDKEGFARGGSPKEFTQQKEAEMARNALSFRNEMDRVPGAMDRSARENAVIDLYRQIGAMDWLPSREVRDLAHDVLGNPNAQLEKIINFYGLDKKTSPYSPKQMYERLAGEAESRAVQKRMDLTPEQSRARYPWLDYDVPVEQQIVR